MSRGRVSHTCCAPLCRRRFLTPLPPSRSAPQSLRQRPPGNPSVTFQLFAGLMGVALDFPGTLRGTAYDARADPWLRAAVLPPKDLVPARRARHPTSL